MPIISWVQPLLRHDFDFLHNMRRIYWETCCCMDEKLTFENENAAETNLTPLSPLLRPAMCWLSICHRCFNPTYHNTITTVSSPTHWHHFRTPAYHHASVTTLNLGYSYLQVPHGTLSLSFTSYLGVESVDCGGCILFLVPSQTSEPEFVSNVDYFLCSKLSSVVLWHPC